MKYTSEKLGLQHHVVKRVGDLIVVGLNLRCKKNRLANSFAILGEHVTRKLSAARDLGGGEPYSRESPRDPCQ